MLQPKRYYPDMAAAKRYNLLNDYHLLSFDELDSTNEEAKRLAKSGSGHGAVIWAKRQTGGKGRMGRQWQSREGNLFVSVLLQPDKKEALLAELSFVTAIAAVEAIQPMVPQLPLQHKWPNDVLLGEKKLAGILLESFKIDGKGKPWIVVGIGVNIDSHPKDVAFPATCLKSSGVELISAKIILSRFIHHFIECYNAWDNTGFPVIRKMWSKRSWGENQPITVRLPDGELQGIHRGLDKDGALLLEVDGTKQRVLAGEVYPHIDA